MKTKIIVVSLVLGILFFLMGTNQDQTVIIYSSLEQFRGDELQKQLDDRLPHIKTKIMYIPTGKAAAKIALEGEKTEADIIVSLETSYMNKVSDHLEDIEGQSRIDYIEMFDMKHVDNKYVIWERQAGAFVINPEVLEKYGLPVPTTYEELLDEKYANLIAMPDPKSSGTGYFFLKNRLNVLGDEAGFAYFDKLEKNVKQFTESGSGPIKLLNQGEIGIGLALTFQAMNEINQGKNFEIVFPPEGSPYSLTGTGLIKGRNNKKNVMEVFDFIINDFIQYDKSYFSPEKIYEGQENMIEGYPQDINYADMDGIQSIEEKERVLKIWKY